MIGRDGSNQSNSRPNGSHHPRGSRAAPKRVGLSLPLPGGAARHNDKKGHRMFGKTKEKITAPARNVAHIAVTALIVAVMTLLMVVAMHFGNGA